MCTELSKKFVLGCVIPPPGAEARSRNLGHTFMSNSVVSRRRLARWGPSMHAANKVCVASWYLVVATGDLTLHFDFQLLYEDNETNRMHESLNLFASIVNNIHFKGKPFIVFFNKFDLFEEKIKTSSLAKFFPDYQGDNRYQRLNALWMKI